MSPIHHISHLQPQFQFLATPKCNYCILHAQLVLPSLSFDNVTSRHVTFLAFAFERRSREIFEGYLFSYIWRSWRSVVILFSLSELLYCHW